MVFYESPHRVMAALKDMLTVLGDRPMALIREVTKKFEEVHRGTISSALECFTCRQPRGEFTFVVAGCAREDTETMENSEDYADDELRRSLRAGTSERDAVREVTSKLKLPRRLVYQRMLAVKDEEPKDPAGSGV